jgi:uncharacterized coiled-coil protein SlyX
MSDLNRRNTAAVEQQLKELNDIVRAQQIRIDGLVALMSTTQERLNQQEQTVAMLRARLTGTGPTK